MIKDIYNEVLSQFESGIITEDELNDYKKLCDEGKKESKPYFITLFVPSGLLEKDDDRYFTTLALSHISKDNSITIMKLDGEIITSKFDKFSISYKKSLSEAIIENTSNIKSQNS